jgi:hypothetical protein
VVVIGDLAGEGSLRKHAVAISSAARTKLIFCWSANAWLGRAKGRSC